MYSLISLFVWKKKYNLFKFSSLSKPLVSWLFFRVDFLIYFISTHIIYLLHVPFICNQISILVTTFILDVFLYHKQKYGFLLLFIFIFISSILLLSGFTLVMFSWELFKISDLYFTRNWMQPINLLWIWIIIYRTNFSSIYSVISLKF